MRGYYCLQVQQAAKDVRRGRADLADIQSVIDFYQAKITPGSDVNNMSDQLKPGDDVIVPSLRIPDSRGSSSGPKDMIEMMKFSVIKVSLVLLLHPCVIDSNGGVAALHLVMWLVVGPVYITF